VVTARWNALPARGARAIKEVYGVCPYGPWRQSPGHGVRSKPSEAEGLLDLGGPKEGEYAHLGYTVCKLFTPKVCLKWKSVGSLIAACLVVLYD